MNRDAKATRRDFLKLAGTGAAALTVAPAISAGKPSAGDRPNILWLVSEDSSPYFGCYGDKYARTPNLDKLAAEGILYENAFANAPVCAPARSTIITGMYACSLGTQHMRSGHAIPRDVRFFPVYLRRAGYYCTNRSKTDYNCSRSHAGAWDECSRRAHWRNRKKGQPFFSVVNNGTTHESCLHKISPKVRHDPAKAPLAPYHPDTPAVRHDYAQLYDRATTMDMEMGKVLKELASQGLAENTIVFYYGDHGGILPRSKRFLYESGTRVPMIVRFGAKWQHLAPGKSGTGTDRPVSFVDLAATVLSLAGVKVPDHMQGRAFLGKQAAAPREYVYGFRGRMDERYDMSRSVRDKKYRYIRNYLPHLPWAQHLNYLWRMKTMKVWQKLHDEGKLTGPQKTFFQTKPVEELFDVQADPHEVNNLAADPKHRRTLERMRAACLQWMRDIRDVGFLHESEFVIRSAGSTPYEMARQAGKYDMERIMAAAELAGRRQASALPELLKLLDEGDSGVRYWGAVGCLALAERAAPAVQRLTKALGDPSPCVRITAAEALVRLGRAKDALGVLTKALDGGDGPAALLAANALDNLDELAGPALPALRRAAKGRNRYAGDVQRVAEKALSDAEAGRWID